MTFSVPVVHAIPATLVHVKQSHADAWTPMPYLYVDTLGESIGGGFGRATLRYSIGHVLQADSDTFSAYERLQIGRWYVRITYTPNTTGASSASWFGVVLSHATHKLGSGAEEQVLTAVTWDWLLTQRQIVTSWVRSGGGVQEIQRPLVFNGGGSGRGGDQQVIVANRNPEHGPDVGEPGQALYVFAEELTTAEVWTTPEVLNYLFRYFPPDDGNGPTWSLHQSVFEHLDWDTPRVVCDGRTLYDILNSLIDSRRGLAWYINSQETGCEIRVASQSPTAIDMGNGREIPENTPVDIDVDDEIQVSAVIVITDYQEVYSQVRTVGARRGACFTIGVYDGTMVKDWTGDDEVDYIAGDPSVAGSTTDEDKARHDAYRSSDRLNHVYTRFRLADDWDGMAGNGLGSPMTYVCPVVYPFSGEIAGGGETAWLPGLRFERNAPLLRHHDYEHSIEAPVNNSPANIAPEYLRSFAVANLGYTENVRVMTHELNVASKSETAPGAGIEGASYLRVNPNSPGVYVRPTSMPHAQADAEGTDGLYPKSDHETWFEWQTLIATVYCSWDTHCEAVYPETPGDEINDQESVLTLRVGDYARMDYVAAGTVVDVREGEIVMAQQGGFVRNDHEVLRRLAKVAWQWYSIPRRAVRLSVSHIASDLAIGTLIGELDGEAVNSMVTSVEYSFLDGTTRISTQFSNLDARRMIG